MRKRGGFVRKSFFVLLTFVFLAGFAKADWISDAKSQAQATAESQLKPLVGDVGAALGGGMYGPVKNGGLLGFDVGIRGSFAGISNGTKENIPSLKDESYIPAAWLYVSKGLFFGIDVFGRYASVKMNSSDDSIDLVGAGLEYTVIEDGLLKPVPGVSVLAAANTLSAKGVSVRTISLAATVSKKLPFVTPFATLAMDTTEMDVDLEAGITAKPKASGSRISAGIELRLIPFTYFNIAASKTAGSEMGFQLGIGIKN